MKRIARDTVTNMPLAGKTLPSKNKLCTFGVPSGVILTIVFFRWSESNSEISRITAARIAAATTPSTPPKPADERNVEVEQNEKALASPIQCDAQLIYSTMPGTILHEKRMELAEALAVYKRIKSPLQLEAAIICLGQAPLHRIEILSEAYSQHFAHLAFLAQSPYEERDRGGITVWPCYEDSSASLKHPGNSSKQFYHTSYAMRYYPYVCVAAVLQWFLKKMPSLQGFVFFHADFFLHPSYLAARLRTNPVATLGAAQGYCMGDKVGSLTPLKQAQKDYVRACRLEEIPDTPPKTNAECVAEYPENVFDVHQCAKVGDFEKMPIVRTRLPQFNVNVPSIHATFQQIDRMFFPHSPATHNRLCYGWSDFYRLPRDLWELFLKIALMLANRTMIGEKFHEVVVPTILTKLAASSGRSVHMMHCFGSTTHRINTSLNFRAIFELPCGHRLRLLDKGVPEMLRLAMRDG